MISKRISQLDQIVVDIEYLLISVIQGVALAALASSASTPLAGMQIEFFLYITSAFLIILIFWSQAIIHTLSFLDWPISLEHSFLYFLVSLIEVIAISHVTDPLRWFGAMTAFFIVTIILYIYDWKLIQRSKVKFQISVNKLILYKHILNRQKFELIALLPLALLFNMVAFLLILKLPEFFIQQKAHIYLILIQTLFSLLFFLDATVVFKQRMKLITQTA